MSTICVVLPCYKSKDFVVNAIQSIPKEVQLIVCVDDACPVQTGLHVQKNFASDPRVKVIFHEQNTGVGGATLTGWKYAIEQGADILIKMDSDGQMDGKNIQALVAPIANKNASYTKGNRFFSRTSYHGMPIFRVVGNLVLTFASKASSGYWGVMDPLNGFLAISSETLKKIDDGSISKRYLFESDMLYRLFLRNCTVQDVNMNAIYGDEISNFRVRRNLPIFLKKYITNYIKRIFIVYFVRDFNAGSFHLLISLLFLFISLVTGIPPWIHSLVTKTPANLGTIILPTLAAIFSMQGLIAFFDFDVKRGSALSAREE